MSWRPKPLRFHRNSIRLWLLAVGVVWAEVAWPPWTIGTVLVVGAAVFRFWVKGYLTQSRSLCTAGPYSLCRHPFYLGNLFLDLGICLLIGRIEVAIPYLLLWFALHQRQMAREELKLANLFPGDSDSYRVNVPRLFPRPGPVRVWRALRSDGFSWSNPNITQRKEVPRLLIALAYPLLFLTVDGFQKQGRRFLTDANGWQLLSFGGLVVLATLSLVLRKWIRKRSRALQSVATQD